MSADRNALPSAVQPKSAKPRGIMMRLRSDVRGATLPMMAAAIVPIAAMVGAGLDMSRVYLVRTRLQQACDAGAVAVRRSMSATNTATASETDKAEGYKFFDVDFPANSYGTTDVSRTYVGTTGTNGVGNVDGDASAIMPTSVMKLFMIDTLTLSTTCSATVSIPNTDVMFVLDISGSMAAKAVSTDTVTKLAGLKDAVKTFYVTLGKGTETGAGRIRYGFVPYSSNANVGAVVKAAGGSIGGIAPYIAGGTAGETATYRSRTPHTYTENYITGYSNDSNPTNGTITQPAYSPASPALVAFGTSGTTTVNGTNYTNRTTNVTVATCNGYTKPYPAATPVNSVVTQASAVGPTYSSEDAEPTYPDVERKKYYNTTQLFTRTGYNFVWTQTAAATYTSKGVLISAAKGNCDFSRGTQTSTKTTPSTTTRTASWASRLVADYWTYGNQAIDVTSLVAGNSINNPTYWTGTSYVSINANPSSNASQTNVSSTLSWPGCLEESTTINTITKTSSLNIPATAKDMSIDLKPATLAEKWKPWLPALVFDSTDNRWQDDNNWRSSGWAACPSATTAPATKLRQFTSDVDGTTKLSASFKNYVDGLTAIGGTQHDLGMIWGARLLSPDGILGSENSDETAPGGFAIGRHIVFMTDGVMDARNQNYGPWGIPRLDGRQVPTTQVDTDDGSTDMNDTHNRRMLMICNAAKSKGYTIWIVGFGMTAMPQTLKDCASDADHWSLATSSAELKTKFSNIASQIGGLRLSH